MNKPYIKQLETINDKQICINEITKDKPYLHNSRSQRGKSKRQYIILTNHVTGEYVGKLKIYGNNRANTCKRTNKNSRQHLN